MINIVTDKENRIITSAAIIITTLVFCSEMTLPARLNDHFDIALNLIMLACILYGLVKYIMERKRADAIIVVITVIYFIARIISYKLNGKTITYGGAMMVQAFYLIGINRWLFAGKSGKKITFYTFLAFDVLSILLGYYNNYFRYEETAHLMQTRGELGIDFKTSAFQNTNYAGMLTGAAIVLCIAMIINENFKKRTLCILLPVIALNLYTLIRYTACRSAETGLIITAIAFAVVVLIRKMDSVKLITGLMLIACFLTLIPLRMLVYSNNNEEYLADVSPMEQLVDKASTDRYALWKMTILSQEGHELFGYANSSNATDKRKELLNNFDQSRVADNYRVAVEHPRQHNGYVATYNEAGIIGTLLLLTLLLRRIWKLKGRFRDGQWEYLLLIYIFWVNLFEAKLINATFFTGFLMMVLLMPDGKTELIGKHEKVS